MVFQQSDSRSSSPVLTREGQIAYFDDEETLHQKRRDIQRFATTYLKHADNSCHTPIRLGLFRELQAYRSQQPDIGRPMAKRRYPFAIISNEMTHQSDVVTFLKKAGSHDGQILIRHSDILKTPFLQEYPPECLMVQDNTLSYCTETMIAQWKRAGIQRIIFLVDSACIKPYKKSQILWLGQKMGVHIIFTPINPFILFALVQFPR